MKMMLIALLIFIPISAFAQLKHVSAGQVRIVQLIIKGDGHKCDTVSEMLPLILGRGYKVYCDESNYTYKVERKVSQWVVTAL